MQMTPLQIEILLHYYTRTGEYRDGDFSAPAVREAIVNFVTQLRLLGLVVSPGGPGLELTDRGLAYVERLLSVPC